jgi:hypothetical protein
MDIDKIDNVHPFYRIWYHPLWKEAIKSCFLSDYEDSPFSSFAYLEPPSNVPLQDHSMSITAEDTMRRFNSEIFDKIGHLGNISEAQRVHKMREQFNKLEKIAIKSVHATKYAICGIIEVTNRLGSLSLNSSNLNIQVSAVDKALQRHQKHSLDNSSTLNYLKRKANPQPSVIIGQQSKRNCRICRDQFKEPQVIYSSHRGNSSKCPHFNVVPQSTNTVNTNLSNNDNVTIQSTTTEGMCFANYDNESEVKVTCSNNNDNKVTCSNNNDNKVTCSNNNDNVDNESEVEVTYTNNNDNVDGGLCCVSPSEKYEFPHKSTAEAMVILRTYGTLKDVHGDGSCGYHSIMLLLQKLKLIDDNLSVTAFRRGMK